MLSFDNFNVWYYQIPIFAGFITTVWLLLKFWRHTREQQIRVIPASWNGIRAHQWSLIQCLTHRASTCCLCRSLIVDAMYCDSCGVCLDFQCYDHVTRSKYFHLMKSSERNSILEPLSHCKRVSISRTKENSNQFKHHWVHGNIPSHSKCFICHRYCEEDDEMMGKESGDTSMAEHTLYHYRCCWCQRTVHENCFHKSDSNNEIEGNCDFGKYRYLIIPPHYIIHRRVWTTSQGKAIALDEIRDFSSKEPKWSPLLVIANRKSGNNDAGTILSKFLPILNPLQVIDLSDKSNLLELSLQMCRMLPKNITVRILVAGGDGTIGWVLNTIHQLKLNPSPLVAIFPLGTGNDLARVLGWSDIFDSASNVNHHEIIQSVYNARPIKLDRWSIEIEQIDYYHRSYNLLIESLRIPRSIMPLGNRNLFMYNYFSIGVDALVALNFHQTRKSKIYNFLFRYYFSVFGILFIHFIFISNFSNTFINKFIYFTFGTKDLWERRCKNLQTKIRLELDGENVCLPELESIVVLNIQSWGGGVRLVGEINRFDDSRMEILGLTSSFHIGQVMMGLSKPIFLGQASQVKLWLDEHLPMQIDGEPWLQPPSKVEIKWNSHAKLLQNVM